MGKRGCDFYIGNGDNPNAELMLLLAHQPPYTDDAKRRMSKIMEQSGDNINPTVLRNVEHALNILPSGTSQPSE